jgi:hypothetical protein
MKNAAARRDPSPCVAAESVDPMDNGEGSGHASRAEQRTPDPFPPSGRALTCDDARLANSLLRASAQVAGS